MRCVYAHWFHGRLVESEIHNLFGKPLSVMVIFMDSTIQPFDNSENICAPKIWYELSWFDEEAAYYKMAKRWRG